MSTTFRLMSLATALLLAHQLPGQVAPPAAAPADKSGPRAQFSQSIHNFGKVNAGASLRHDFIVTNIGNALLEITQVKPGCGCTTAGDWDRKIEPGKTGKIPIQFNPGNFSGPVSKAVTVTCNDPAQGTHTLQIQATVWKPIDVQPAFVHFMPTEGEETNDTKVVKITSNIEEPVTLEGIESTNTIFKTELKTIKPGKEFELHVTYAGAATNVAASGPIKIKTSSTNMPLVEVTPYVMPQSAIVAVPGQVSLPANLTAVHKSYVTIRVNSKVPTTISEATVNAEGVKVLTTESQPGKAFSISLEFPAGFQMPVGKPMELTVKTSHPKKPEIKVPITQLSTILPVVGPTAPVGASTVK